MTKQDSAIEYTMAEQDFLYAIDFIGQQYLSILNLQARNESIPRSCLVFIVVFCLIYFTTQAMRMNEQESLFLSVFSGLFLSANSKLILRQNSLKNHKV